MSKEAGANEATPEECELFLSLERHNNPSVMYPNDTIRYQQACDLFKEATNALNTGDLKTAKARIDELDEIWSEAQQKNPTLDMRLVAVRRDINGLDEDDLDILDGMIDDEMSTMFRNLAVDPVASAQLKQIDESMTALREQRMREDAAVPRNDEYLMEKINRIERETIKSKIALLLQARAIPVSNSL